MGKVKPSSNNTPMAKVVKKGRGFKTEIAKETDTGSQMSKKGSPSQVTGSRRSTRINSQRKVTTKPTSGADTIPPASEIVSAPAPPKRSNPVDILPSSSPVASTSGLGKEKEKPSASTKKTSVVPSAKKPKGTPAGSSVAAKSSKAKSKQPVKTAKKTPTRKPKPKVAKPKTIRIWVKESDFDQIYQFKIVLLDSNPEIWRRIQVPHVYNFRQLHWAIQAAMGWRESHHHEFQMHDETRIGVPMSLLPAEMEPLDENKELIANRFSLTHEFNDRMMYEYDMGDGWEHMIQLERIFKGVPKQYYPICVEGENACPPEDVGGLDGYYHFLEVLKNPKHEEYEDLREWADNYGWKDDPTLFNPLECNFFRG